MKDKPQLATIARDNKVNETLDSAREEDFDSVFIVGSKGKDLKITQSGYTDLERKIGAMVLILNNLIQNA
jgi:cobalamin biosynthesis protein CbiD